MSAAIEFVWSAGGESLPSWVEDALRSCPSAGSGVHLWLLSAANALQRCSVPEPRACDLLAEASAGCGRRVPATEIRKTVAKAYGSNWSGNRADALPTANLQRIENLTAPYAPEWSGLDELWQKSPVKLPEDASAAEIVIDGLFPGNPWLCVARNDCDARAYRRSELRGKLHTYAKLVPSPMRSQMGVNESGQPSHRAKSNVGPRTYLVIEFDIQERTSAGQDTRFAPLVRKWAECGMSPKDATSLLLRELSKYLPLVAVVDSRGKSLHGFYYCLAVEEERINRFIRYAISLGADAATRTENQLVRMPGGTRVESGKHQYVIYFNPNAVSKR